MANGNKQPEALSDCLDQLRENQKNILIVEHDNWWRNRANDVYRLRGLHQETYDLIFNLGQIVHYDLLSDSYALSREELTSNNQHLVHTVFFKHLGEQNQLIKRVSTIEKIKPTNKGAELMTSSTLKADLKSKIETSFNPSLTSEAETFSENLSNLYTSYQSDFIDFMIFAGLVKSFRHNFRPPEQN